MRQRAFGLKLLLFLLALSCLLATPAAAADSAPVAQTQPAAPASPAQDPTEQARRHFRTGVKLYQDANYAGALAEFEASYTLK
ncbi:MAG TPA: hypothetical protein VGP93_06600, partial [Polyangiaceae bacterium]|nr:hypothetical protein [Polyangiaceae bacterium]